MLLTGAIAVLNYSHTSLRVISEPSGVTSRHYSCSLAKLSVKLSSIARFKRNSFLEMVALSVRMIHAKKFYFDIKNVLPTIQIFNGKSI